MARKSVLLIAGVLVFTSLGLAQNAPDKKAAPAVPPATQLADEMAARLAGDLHVKTVVGDPIKAGSVTLIPILMIDVSFTGAGMAAPADSATAASTQPGVDGFIASGEARPLGFVAITKKGVRFISVGKTPAK